jgi:hypothetical protein
MADAVLDPENWPIDMLYFENGRIVHQVKVYSSGKCAYKMPDFVGKSPTTILRMMADVIDNPSPENSGIEVMFIRQ